MFYLGQKILVFKVICTFRHLIVNTILSRQISNIHSHRFLSKYKKHLILPTGKKIRNIELEILQNLAGMGISQIRNTCILYI